MECGSGNAECGSKKFWIADCGFLTNLGIKILDRELRALNFGFN
jgi:hypothetical protein